MCLCACARVCVLYAIIYSLPNSIRISWQGLCYEELVKCYQTKLKREGEGRGILSSRQINI